MTAVAGCDPPWPAVARLHGTRAPAAGHRRPWPAVAEQAVKDLGGERPLSEPALAGRDPPWQWGRTSLSEPALAAVTAPGRL